LIDSTASEELLRRYQTGDDLALERLWARYLPRLKKWAHGRLPDSCRQNTSTDDLIQDAFVRSLARLRTLKPNRRESVFAYFRVVVLNQIRDHIRYVARRPDRLPLLDEAHVDPNPSPFEHAVGREITERYERALSTLSQDDQDMILAFVELCCSDRELAELFEKASAETARAARNRAVVRLARGMSALIDRPASE
jgi:RNA polymerase sigma-70 factor, ECF subfamily